MENSYDEECFKKWEIDECEAEMEKVVQWIGKRKLLSISGEGYTDM